MTWEQYVSDQDDIATGNILMDLVRDLDWLIDQFPLMRTQALILRQMVYRELHKDDPPEKGNEE